MIVEEIKELTSEACYHSENMFTSSFFEQHLQLVDQFADELSSLLHANREVVALSAYLHDISAIVDSSTLANHNTESARIAGNILRDYKYSEDNTNSVKQAIIRHTSPIKENEGTLEEICLSNADAMSQIANPSYWMFYVYNIRSMSFQEGREWYKKRINSNYNQMIQPAKEIINEQYQIVKQMFE